MTARTTIEYIHIVIFYNVVGFHEHRDLIFKTPHCRQSPIFHASVLMAADKLLPPPHPSSDLGIDLLVFFGILLYPVHDKFFSNLSAARIIFNRKKKDYILLLLIVDINRSLSLPKQAYLFCASSVVHVIVSNSASFRRPPI